MDLLRKDEKPDIHTREYVTTNQYTEMNNLNNLKMLSLLLSACFATASCVSDKVEMGPTIDEIDIIEKDHTDDSPEIGYEECLGLAQVTELMAQKAIAYTEASQNTDKTLLNCVYVYAPTVEKYKDAPEKLAARISLLGFKGVYLSPGGKRLTTADNWLRTFISTCSDLAMEVYATYYEDPTVFVSEAAADDCLNKVMLYNRSVTYKERFAGISADLEPHTIKKDIGLGWIWNTNEHNGIGGQNDNLLKVTIDRLRYAGKKLHPAGLKLHEAIWCHYQEMYEDGKVSHGDIGHFVNVCDLVSLMAYRSTTDRVWDISTPSMDACEKAKAINICVKTATNDEASTTLQPNGWKALLDTMAELKRRGMEYECFNGLDMFTYEALETMWEWINDKN